MFGEQPILTSLPRESMRRRARRADCVADDLPSRNRQQAARKQHLAVDGAAFHQSVFDKHQDLEAAIAPCQEVLDFCHALALASDGDVSLEGVAPEVRARLEAATGGRASPSPPKTTFLRRAIAAEAASPRNDGRALCAELEDVVPIDDETSCDLALRGLALGLRRAAELAPDANDARFLKRAYAVDKRVLDLKKDIARVFAALALDEAAVAKLSGDVFGFLGSLGTYPAFLPEERRYSSPFRRRRPGSETRRPPPPAAGDQAIPGPGDFPRLGSGAPPAPPPAWPPPQS